MSTLKTNNVQVGQSATATQNFTLYQPSVPDGTVRLGVGNSGVTSSDVAVVSNAGNLMLGTATWGYAGNRGIQNRTSGSDNSSIFLETASATIKGFMASDPTASRVGLGSLSAHPLVFIVNDAERARIDTAGRVTMPYQPMFYGARDDSTYTNTGEANYVIFQCNLAYVNVGSCYNTSTGRFTCPIAGVYEVSFNALTIGNASFNAYVYKNAAQYATRQLRCITNGNNDEQNGGFVCLVNAAANDVLDVRVSGSAGQWYGPGANAMTIKLIG